MLQLSKYLFIIESRHVIYYRMIIVMYIKVGGNKYEDCNGK